MDLLNSSHQLPAPANQSDFSSVFTQQVLPPLYSLLCVVGVSLNGLAAWLFFRVPSDSGLVVYLKNMVVADLLMLVTLPLKVAAEVGLGGWRLQVAVCRYSAVLFYSSMYAGIVFMGLIGLDRYHKVVRRGCGSPPAAGPSSSAPPRGVGVARGLALLTWCLLLLSVLPNALLTSRPARGDAARHCMALKTSLGVQWHRVSTLLCVALFWATLLLLSFCYASIARRVYRSYRRVRRDGSRAYRRSGRSIVSLLAVFFVCFVPYHVCRVPYTLSQVPGVGFSADARFLLFQLKEGTLFLSALNVCLDPVVYFLMCGTFRESLLRRLSGRERSSLNTAQSLSNL